MPLAVFWRSTIGEVLLMIDARNERTRQDMAAQVGAVLRALGAAFGSGDTDPFDGLVDKAEAAPVSMAEVRRMRFWRPPNGD